MSSNGTPNASDSPQGLTPTPSPVCTRVCTSEPENDNAGTLNATSPASPPQAPAPDADQGDEGEGIDQGGAARGSSTADQGDPLVKLAAALANLSPADRARLAAMLTGHQGVRGFQS
ncbi:MAG: hypothetical protein ABSF26_09500 [Thermoguttaceae bacterium]